MLPGADCVFDVVFETRLPNVYRLIQRQLQSHKEERKGPTILCVQSVMSKVASDEQIELSLNVFLFFCSISNVDDVRACDN